MVDACSLKLHATYSLSNIVFQIRISIHLLMQAVNLIALITRSTVLFTYVFTCR